MTLDKLEIDETHCIGKKITVGFKTTCILISLTSFSGWTPTILYVAGSLSMAHVSDRHKTRGTGSWKECYKGFRRQG